VRPNWNKTKAKRENALRFCFATRQSAARLSRSRARHLHFAKLHFEEVAFWLSNFRNRSTPVGTLLRYLMAFGVQLAWQKTGKSGATPPMRMPFGKNKGKSVPLPVIGPWQMMIALWLGRQIWAIYGNQIKSKLQNTAHPVAKHVGGLLPDVGTSPAGSTPGTQSRPAPQYGTRQLDPATSDAGQNGSGNLPPGSILNSLRKAS
jgi:hypothetical protein